MKRIALAMLTSIALATAAQAHPLHRHHTQIEYVHTHSGYNNGRPSAWCSWWLRRFLHVTSGVVNNLALSWLNWGHATSPHEHAVVVWNHGHGHGHVGVITGQQCGPQSWVVTSGNDGHAVRTRCRFVGNAAGFREGA